MLQDHIHTYDDLGRKVTGGNQVPFRDFLRVLYQRVQGQPLPPVPTVPLPQYQARVNWGRWIVDCPHCNSALDVTSSDTMAICVDCGTEWFEVVFPPPQQKRPIERALLKRPGNRAKVFSNSNWTPGETVANLERENRERGID
mgnify:CR=1 FL=1